jgi:chromosomal replication initiator protein
MSILNRSTITVAKDAMSIETDTEASGKASKNSLWNVCLDQLKNSSTSAPTQEECDTWLNPLQVEEYDTKLVIWSPNQFVSDSVKEKFLSSIQAIYSSLKEKTVEVIVKEGPPSQSLIGKTDVSSVSDVALSSFQSYLNIHFTFSNFVEGKSNQLARAAAIQIAESPGAAYNPLLLYGGVGLGKTHLLHAVGNYIQKQNIHAKVLYVHSEKFVSDMVRALRTNTIELFKQYYRSLDCLLIDDIQFFSGKDRSQEEFFHTFNSFLEGHRQLILTCDRYPKEIPDVEERLKSRLGSGLTVSIEPPDLETRVAILINKATQTKLKLPQEVAFFIAKRIHSNIRELEGVLKRISAYSQFMGKPITMELVKEAIRDILAIQDKQVTIDNIIKTVSEYYGKDVDELLDKTRKAKIAQARQVAMALTKELTNHSYTEIAKAFGGRDHTTVLYAVKKISKERLMDTKLGKNFTYLLRILSGD